MPGCRQVAGLPAGRLCRRLAKLSFRQADAACPPPYLQEALHDEVIDAAKRLYAAGQQLLVIDTESPFLSTGLAQEVAHAAQGRYYQLPAAADTGGAIAALTAAAMAEARL